MASKNGNGNGAAPKPIRTAVIEFDDQGYTGWKATVRLNVPLSVARMAEAPTMDELMKGLQQIIVGWNFVDEEGNALPQPIEGGLESCPLDLLEPISRGFQEKLREVSVIPKA